MTAPLTPAHQQPPYDSRQDADAPGAVSLRKSPEEGEEGPGMRTEARQSAVIFFAVAVGGVLLGLLWLWLSPRIPLIADSRAVYLKDSEGEQAIGVDGTFTLVAAGLGLLSALAVFLVRRRGGVLIVVGLALGALAASVVGWRLGLALGPEQDVVAHAKHVGRGVAFDAPLELKAKGALLAWPLVAMLAHLGLTAAFGPRDPEPAPAFYPVPTAGHPGHEGGAAPHDAPYGRDHGEQGPGEQGPERPS
ncbi:hypothetical protein [Streptomyces sp. NPDC050560]|uniref:hypothetical protein n=1 Tax=Streptomyces sp. NPDC050560 TaxID=3365630 RepID=UPI0037AFC05B